MTIASVLIIIVLAYAALGGIFTLALLARGLSRVDPSTVGAGLAFRMLIAPGCVALWPVLAVKWARAGQPRREPAP